jgi:hypothetical protein
MIAFSLSLLALAAGTALLIQIRRDYLGVGFAAIAWLIIGLSLISLGYNGTQIVRKKGDRFHYSCCKKERKCQKKNDCCTSETENTCNINNDRVKKGLCIVDREVCSAKMGKAACDSLCALRGGCYLRPEECAALGIEEQKEKSCCKKQ